MVLVEGGTFTMGSPTSEVDRGSDETQHQVTVSNFYMGKYEVTQAQWRAVMGNNPASGYGVGDNYPVYNVSWNDIQTFLQKLNTLTGKTYRLPTEAEWEYAARGGNKSKGYTYAGSNDLGQVAEYDGNNNKSTKPVGGKQPNELGLYDMSGNVWEWCNDWYGSYSSSSQTNPTGAASGSHRVLRGGSWGGIASSCRVAIRGSNAPDGRYGGIGFRLVVVP